MMNQEMCPRNGKMRSYIECMLELGQSLSVGLLDCLRIRTSVIIVDRPGA